MRVLRELHNISFAPCKMGDKLPRLDFAGISALVGANATKAGIPYTCLVRSRLPYLNAYVPIGTLGLAQAVLACIDWRPARILTGAGEAGSMLELCSVKASGTAKYVGLKSATALPVRGVVGEAVVLELVRRGKLHDCQGLIGRDAGRQTTVVWADVFESDNIGGEVRVAGNMGALINYLATTVCVVVLVLAAMCHEWLCFALVAIGMVLNSTMALLLRVQKFEFPSVTPAKGVPAGDSVIVLEDDPDAFCVLRGSETAIQKLLQKEIILKPGCVERLPLFLVSVAFMIYSAVMVLGVPNMSPSAQLLFLVVVSVGSMTDLVKGSWNGKRHMAKEAMEKYGIQIVDVLKFGNRTASLACVAAGNTKLDTLKAAGLCPTAGAVWDNWWNALRVLGDNQSIDKIEIQKKISDNLHAPVPQEDEELWKTLQEDLKDGHRNAILRIHRHGRK